MRVERQHFRVEYPKEAQPSFVVMRAHLPIVNLSEGGILFRVPLDPGDDPPQRIGEVVKGMIVFKDQNQVYVEGKVLRVHSDCVAIELEIGIPLGRIMHEQRQLIADFGTLKQPK